MRTTTEWQALLDGTTPGPWELVVQESGDAYLEAPASLYPDGLPQTVFETLFWDHKGDLTLAAAAPDAVREVIRLREAIEWLRSECYEVVKDPQGHEDYTPNDVAHNIELAHYNTLARILEGEA